jgi:hypothetical protein
MADEHYKWLDRDAAERLLRGEALKAVDADIQGRADRLAEALGALAAAPAPSSAELPGEAAALAAFRKVHTGMNGEAVQLGRRSRTHAVSHSADAGLVRLGRPAPAERPARRGRPMRFGLAAALAVGMIGGVAVAAGTGVLPTPFRDDSPNPAATVSAAVTPDRPLVSPSPGASETDGSQVPLPGASESGTSGSGSSDDEALGGTASGKPGSSGVEKSGRTLERWLSLRSSCRDILAGKGVGAGRKRVLEDAAGGGGRVKSYCKGVLGQTGAGSAGEQNSQSGQDDQDGQQSDQGSGSGSDQGSGGSGGDNSGDDEGNHILPRGHHQHSGGGILTPSTAPSALPLLLPRESPSSPPATPKPAPTPTPTYSALPVLSAL